MNNNCEIEGSDDHTVAKNYNTEAVLFNSMLMVIGINTILDADVVGSAQVMWFGLSI